MLLLDQENLTELFTRPATRATGRGNHSERERRRHKGYTGSIVTAS